MPVLTVFGTRRDPHVEAVCDHIEANGRRCLVLDHLAPLDWSLSINGARWALYRPGEAPITEIGAIWNRSKISLPVGGPNYRTRYIEAGQWLSFYAAIADLAAGPIINPSVASTRRRTKIGEMQIASRVGLVSPVSIIPRDIANLKRWSEGRDIVLKPLGFANAPSETDEGQVEAVMTMPVSGDDLDADSGGLGGAPHFFQHRIQKDFELRVIATRAEMHAFRINSQGEAVSQVDWRYGSLVLQYEPIKVDADLKSCLIKYLIEADLYYGSFDIIVTRKGALVFLECNSEGQWWWLQQSTGVDIAKSIAEAIMLAENA